MISYMCQQETGEMESPEKSETRCFGILKKRACCICLKIMIYWLDNVELRENEQKERIPHMARKSTKENKNIYQITRENLDLTREAASERLETISPERIEKIENERTLPYPDEVLVMAEKYKQPSLCNYYCANQCPIGQQYVPEIKIKDLSQIVLEMLASLNSVQKKKERLIEITVDGKISGDELEDFVFIQEELERISIAVETLQLWSERMLATGAIDPERYRAYKGK